MQTCSSHNGAKAMPGRQERALCTLHLKSKDVRHEKGVSFVHIRGHSEALQEGGLMVVVSSPDAEQENHDRQ